MSNMSMSLVASSRRQEPLAAHGCLSLAKPGERARAQATRSARARPTEEVQETSLFMVASTNYKCVARALLLNLWVRELDGAGPVVFGTAGAAALQAHGNDAG